MDDSVQIKCNRCKTAFRDRARRLQNGYSRQCPTCEVLLFYDAPIEEWIVKMNDGGVMGVEFLEQEGVPRDIAIRLRKGVTQ